MNKEIDKIIPGETNLVYLGSSYYSDRFNEGESYLVISGGETTYKLKDNCSNSADFLKGGILDYFEIEKQETKPVYTKTMFDNGDKLVSGMLFIGQDGDNGWCECKCIAVGNNYDGTSSVLYEYSSACSIGCCWMNNAWVRPIDNRTDKEKVYDKVLERLTQGEHSTGDDANIAIEYTLDYLDALGIDFTGSK